MGHNSTDALEAFMRSYLAQCTVKGGRIITPPQYRTDFDPTAGGHRLNNDPKFNNPDQGGGSARDQ